MLSFFRAVPDIVFALIFVTAVGLGPFAGVLALICHNTGAMGKHWAESMEEIDDGLQEALRTAGANRLQQVANATLPALFLPAGLGFPGPASLPSCLASLAPPAESSAQTATA